MNSPFRSLRRTLALGGATCALLAGACSRPDDGPNEAKVRVALTEGARAGHKDASWEHLDPQVARARQNAATWDDRKEGPLSTFYDSGVRQSEGGHVNGKKQGLWQFWHENGRLRWQGTYVDDEIDGKVLTWYETGQIETIIEYDDGRRDGLATSFWEDGMPRSEGTYRDDRRSGAVRYWNRDGSPDVERSGVYERDERERPLRPELLKAAELPPRPE